MDSQQNLFVDSPEDAIGVAVLKLGGPKRVGSWLYPALAASAAEQRVRACLNSERPEKFSQDEVLLIAERARVVGDHTIMTYFGKQLGYVVTPIEPEDETMALDRRIADGLDELNKLLRLRDRKTGLRAAGERAVG